MFLGNVLIKLQKPSGSAFFLHCANSHIYVGQCWGDSNTFPHYLSFFFFNRYFYLLIVGQGLFLVARGGYSVVAVHKLLNELASLGA